MLDITVGAPQAHRNLTIFPLVAAGAPELPYTLLADALAAGTVRIGEVGQGTVPALAAQNVADADVLVLDGEQLIGSKQNRMTNRSLLLPARSTIEIPVSCMEHGRWHFDSREMRPAPQHSPAKVRRHAREVEARRVRAGQVAAYDALQEVQGQVWDAIAAGTLRIGEVGQGMVPTLLAQNAGDVDVLLLDGEQLIGSKQNRMANRSILLPARSTVHIPVSCMEHGRWHFDTDVMSAAPQYSPAKLRRRAREVEARHACAGMPASPVALQQAQGEVWDSIAETADKLGGHTPTGAMDAIYQANARRLDEMERAFPAVPGQVGLLAFAGPDAGDVVGLDLVGGRTLYGRLHARLLRGDLLDALDRAADRAGHPVAAAQPATAQAYLAAVRTAARAAAPTVGKGSYAVLTGSVIGGELLDSDAVVHLSAFPPDERDRRPVGPGLMRESPLARPSDRRRGRRLP